MAHGNVTPCSFRLALFGAALMLSCAPLAADEMSYLDAFERRVSDIGNRGALDSFVIEAVNQGQYDQALSTLEEVLLRNPSDIGARIAMARIYYQISSYDVAAAHIEQALLTPGWEAFEKEIEELKAKIDRAQSGYQFYASVTGGVDYKNVSKTVYDFAPPSEADASKLLPYVMVNGVVIRDLETASADDIRVGGWFRYTRDVGDLDFDNQYANYDDTIGRAYVTYSKGLPDLVDTLRFDVTGYVQSQNMGDTRRVDDFGTELQLSWQPSVESQVRVFGGYGWLGNSKNYYTEHRATYGVSGEYRLVAGVALGVYATGFHEWGTSPEPYDYDPGIPGYVGYDFEAEGYEVGASVSHLAWVFEDGRSWVHEAGVRYAAANVLDYASLSDFYPFYDMTDRESWEVFWNHTVQVAKDTVLDFGAYYGEADYTGAVVAFDRSTEYWGLKGALTFQFN